MEKVKNLLYTEICDWMTLEKYKSAHARSSSTLFHPSWNTETVEWLDKEWKGQNAASLESEVPKSLGKIKSILKVIFCWYASNYADVQ